ncbi:hypothetical protein Tco_0950822 [Tanacetum coccineum]
MIVPKGDHSKTPAIDRITNLPSDRKNIITIRSTSPPLSRFLASQRIPKDNRAILTLGSLVSTPKEILATEHQLCLPQPPPLVGVPSKENLNKYCDYHNEKGHSTNDCFHLKKQLEIALESGKLNHLVKDVRQRGKGGQKGSGPQKGKVINMVRCQAKDQKRKSTMIDKELMNVPITFPPILAQDLLEEALMVEAEVEGYLVRMIHILGEQVKPLGKIKLDVCFGGDGLCRRTITKFTVIPALSPYNIILGRLGLKQLQSIPFTIHGMMKFPTSWGIATLVSQTTTVFKCRRATKKQAVKPSKEADPQGKVSLTKKVLVKPAYPDKLVAIGKNLSPVGSAQFKSLLKKNKDIFAWESSDMIGVPRRIIKNALNANPSITPVSQKRKVFSLENIQVVTHEVVEWLKADIVRPMSFGLKNAGATYQRLVDAAFQSQIGQKLEAYVNDMVVKSKTEKEMIADVAKIFDNL